MALSTSFCYAASAALVAFPYVVVQQRKRRTSGIILYVILAIVLAYAIVFPTLTVLVNRLAPYKYDELLYRLDGALGLSVVGFSGFMPYPLYVGFVVIYKSLLWVMTIWAWMHLEKAWGRFEALFNAILISYATAGFLYLFAPGCGPSFSLHLFRGSSAPMLASCPDPTAMPSMHVATAIILVFFAGPTRWMRIFSVLYLAGVSIGTVLAAEHYFIDWVPAIPLAAFVVHAAEKKYRHATIYFALTVGWLSLVRIGGAALLAPPAILWGLVLLTIAVGVEAVTQEWMRDSHQPIRETPTPALPCQALRS